jgi:hypothetical protein
MASSAEAADAAVSTSAERVAVSWLVWVTVAAGTAIVAATHWDFSWHRSIGRDTFFSPPHCLFYSGALLALGAATYTIFAWTFWRRAGARAASIGVWGFRGPLGAFVSAWGGLAMLASGPFDNWWHEVYGLDIVIQSPPHMVLLTGMLTLVFGSLLLAIAHQNAVQPNSSVARGIVLFNGGVALTLALGSFTEDTFTYLMRGARFYGTVALVVPGILAAVAHAADHRYGATIVAGVYTSFILGAILILPLFPAEPRLGPVMQPITHFVPPSFPLLLLPAALAVDQVRLRFGRRSFWFQSLVAGSAFMAVFVAVQWPFAGFLQTDWADNWLFVSRAYPYFVTESSPMVRRIFLPTETTAAEFWGRMALAVATAVLVLRAGFEFGGWLRKLKR